MRLTHLTLKNIGGLANFEADIPPVALISGANGKGKSTICDALMYAAGRRIGPSGARGVEHDPTMLHGNAERGEIICQFDDPDGNLEYLKCNVLPDETTRWTKAKDSKKYVKAGSNLDEYFNALGYDPFKLKAMPPKERVENLLRIIPPAVTAEEIKQAVGGVVPCSPFPAIDTIQALHDDIFRQRTEINRDADTLAKQAQLLADAPGVGDGQDWVSKLTDLRGDMSALVDSENEEALRIQREFNAAKTAAAEVRRLADIQTDKAIDGHIAVLNAQRATLKMETLRTMDASVAEARSYAETERVEFAEANKEVRDRLVSDIADAEARARLQQEADGTRRAAAKTADDAVKAQKLATELTGAIDRLRALKSEVSKRMDLDGVTIAAPRAGLPVDLCREESGALVPFSAWNTRDQEGMCLRIALKAQARCGLVIVDSIGNFDEAAREDLRETCRHYADVAGISFLVGHATGGPLKVERW